VLAERGNASSSHYEPLARNFISSSNSLGRGRKVQTWWSSMC